MTIQLRKYPIINEEVADAAHRQRARNLGTVLNHDATLPKGGTPFQRETLVAFRYEGLSGFQGDGGTVKGSLLVPAVNGGSTEEWVILVSKADVVHHLGHPYAM